MAIEPKHRIVVPKIAQEVLHSQLRNVMVRWSTMKAGSEEERYAEDDIRNMIRRQLDKHARAAIILDRDRQTRLAAPRVPLEFMTQKIEYIDGAWHTTLINISSEHDAVPLHPTLFKGV